MASDAKSPGKANMPGTAVTESTATEMHGEAPGPIMDDGHLPVSELIADRPAAPSPFGDDQTFPLPVDRLTYTPTMTP
uniref:Uncharacterized protein n=1 Tax=uncultured bacterium BAC AB649/1850 TaxID=1037453 RepID=F6K118_9BACT|nr:hypothetical protein [uncultured bacterium BAC AB649/1850]